MALTIEGFWLPKDLKETTLAAVKDFDSLSYASGRPSQPDDEGAVTALWPRLNREQWQNLLARLDENRRRVPKGREFWNRLQAALVAASQQFADPSNPLRIKALNALPGYTGYSEPMIRSTLGALDMMSLEAFPSAYALSPTYASAHHWQSMDGLPGQMRFYRRGVGWRLSSLFPFLSARPIFKSPEIPHRVVGYGAGNVPGTALLIGMLSLATTLAGTDAPVLVLRNSRQEPIFTPLVLEAFQQIDPDLVGSTAVLVWDYADSQIQELLLSQADLVLAAASDETITQIRAQLKACNPKPSVRFHAHGHKVSFSVIGREMLERGLADPLSGGQVLDIVALLAALDSVYWDQFGCLSARIHFIEDAGESGYSPMEYSHRLEQQLRLLAEYLPRGAWPRQAIHDRFDRYKQLESTGQVEVLSHYDDEFVLVLDERTIKPGAFIKQVNDCQGRVIVVRPVSDISEIPHNYLRHIPSTQLQSLSVAIGCPGDQLEERFLRFAEACGACGVTAIRTIGRGAFPQLAYSWDGLLPLDLVRTRPPGHFTTIEFDKPCDQILETHALMLQRGAAMGFLPP